MRRFLRARYTASDGVVQFRATVEGAVSAGAKHEQVEGTHTRDRRERYPGAPFNSAIYYGAPFNGALHIMVSPTNIK